MNLRRCPLLYLFLETPALERQRRFLEAELGLPVIELDTRPQQRHGVAKYDAANLVISLNLAPDRRFGPDSSDGLVTVLSVDARWEPGAAVSRAGPGGLRTDPDGHHYAIQPAAPAGAPATSGAGTPAAVVALRLRADDLSRSARFYEDVLGLQPVGRSGDQARFAAGQVELVLEQSGLAADGRRSRTDTYLLVFHTDDIAAAAAELAARGVVFLGRRIGAGEVGRTVRFLDPSGHRFCLYEPSAESLNWPSGPTVRDILARTPAPAGTEGR
jgi:predicted enzyme related to lactoylglutathione lyase